MDSQSYSSLSDYYLCELTKDSDHRAYSEIYLRFNAMLIKLAYQKTQDEDLAKDIVQDVFTKLWQKRECWIIPSNLGGYLATSIKNAFFSYLEHQNVKSKYIQSLSDYFSTGNTGNPDFLIREQQFQAYIDEQVGQLPRKMQQTFKLSRYENLSHQEIAQRLDTTEGNVSKQITNALKILRGKLHLFVYLSYCTRIISEDSHTRVVNIKSGTFIINEIKGPFPKPNFRIPKDQQSFVAVSLFDSSSVYYSTSLTNSRVASPIAGA